MVSFKYIDIYLFLYIHTNTQNKLNHNVCFKGNMQLKKKPFRISVCASSACCLSSECRNVVAMEELSGMVLDVLGKESSVID